jgi:hypothetical protein
VLKPPVDEAEKNDNSSTNPVDKSVGRHDTRPTKAKDSLPFPDLPKKQASR